jgi:hypothetical protein
VSPGHADQEELLPPAQKVTDVRLPRHLAAEKYTLKLIPFILPDNFTIKGYVEVNLRQASLSQA